tara:strand:- start:1262 stop:1969 length:708 start_codon:yes stop_codon:yes gene_type:complete
MVNITKKYINIYYWLRKLVFTKLFNYFFLFTKTTKRKIIFYLIYKSNHWRSYKKPIKDESVSGLGSDLKITKKLIVDLNNFIISNNIASILDIGCGDFNWMKHIVKNNSNIKYLGIDIVKDIINKNNKLYSNLNVNFKCDDVLNYKFSFNYDLVLFRDFFIHIKNEDIVNMIDKIKLNNCKYFAINNFPKIKKNTNVKGYGHHRLINIEINPFNLNQVFYKIEDYDRELNIYKNI